ncbi:MAG: alanine--tRNA ligase [Bacteroidetes bacterium]|nr:alanine--tRNA ligase [Bacteroidota bacterium]
MDAGQIRDAFLQFFRTKGHQIVPSAPMVIKDDPTLMFTNAGMNQFKEIFLGHSSAKYTRVANIQKCLRVSGKHNDLEEVGIDTYHHTMFEMLGNWSFGDYFKTEAIEWAWELLTVVLGISKDDLYVTVFAGDEPDSLPADTESFNLWKNIIGEDRIIFGSQKDNFWEMGDTGPCGPCSEIHADIRSRDEKIVTPGRELINMGHPQVIEIWNLVFIEYNRSADGHLEPLPQKHIDTGMGFERLCMVLQGKKSNYDTDIFQPVISEISKVTSIHYGDTFQHDVAMRVIADHLRAVAFAIADGQLPSNTGAGYVIRRILRRAVRYGFTFLNQKEPFIHELLPILVSRMKAAFPELARQQDMIRKVIAEEELSFLRTLAFGIKRFEQYVAAMGGNKTIEGIFAFDLFDTYGFPIDLTQLMAKELGLTVDMEGFSKGMNEQKERSRQAAVIDSGDWIILSGNDGGAFIGYDILQATVRITRYRKVTVKNEEKYQLVFDKTPFYPESGGQIGDKGYIEQNGEKILITDTKKEHNLIVHYADKLPAEPSHDIIAVVDQVSRTLAACNHSATHLLHNALREVLGKFAEQKGSFVGPTHLRFDFSHYQKLSNEELARVEALVNQKIRQNITLDEKRTVPIHEALALGAIAFFGEKYGDQVRVIRFDNSIELCGGTHVTATGQIGLFKIISESAIAAGIRRIEAITADRAEAYINSQIQIIDEIKNLLKNPGDVVKSVSNLLDENLALQKQIEKYNKKRLEDIKKQLIDQVRQISGVNFIGARIDIEPAALKDLVFDLRNSIENMVVVLGSENNGKANLTIMISDNLVKERGLHAGTMIREVSKEISGGGGGQAHYASAGGNDPVGINRAIQKVEQMIS